MRFGLKLGTEERFERDDPIKIAALSARSFGDAVERLSRYKQLTFQRNPCSRRGNERTVEFVWLLAHEKSLRCVDVCFRVDCWYRTSRHWAALNPKRVEFQRTPVHRECMKRISAAR